jgi:DNA-binding GntR family transcriptional regulator
MTDPLHGWRALAEQLSEQISSGRLAPGQRLPSEQQLRQRTGLSRTTVRAAIAELRRLGQVQTRHPAGTFVLGLRNTVALLPGESVTASAALVVTGLDGATRTLAAGTRIVAAAQGPSDG